MENRLKQINKEINGATVVWQRFFEKKIKELAGGIDMNNIFVACQDENCLYSINEKGSIIWKIDAEGSIKKIKTSIEGKVLVFISNDTSLWCVDRAGIVLWKVKLGEIIDVCISGSGNVVACSFFDENKKPKLALFSKSGYSLWQKNVENIIEKISMSFDGGAIICSSGKKVEQYTKVGERTWSSTLPSNVKQIAVASSGLLIYVLADALYSISPAGKERWKISIPGGSISSVAISSDGFVNVGYTGREGNRVFRYDVRGELLWKHLSPEDVDIIRMAY
ncbi:MAG: PQQ-binding-like beta-propeller repeat protein, partial [Candidatus Thermoplasmatota archaeon]